MAITNIQQGGRLTPPTPEQAPTQAVQSDPPSLDSRLAEYRILLRKDRRRRYLGLAAVGVGLLWLVLAALPYFNAGFSLALPLGIGLSLLMPGMALLYEAIRQPTPFDTARTLDSLLDDRQRVLTSVELLNGKQAGVSPVASQASIMASAQLSSTARLLAGVEPRALYPARMPVAQLTIAGGLLVIAVGIWLLKGANDDFALASGGLPPGLGAGAAVPTATALSGLPDANSDDTQAGTPPSSSDSDQQGQSNQPGVPDSNGGQGSTSASGPSISADAAQQQAEASRQAEKSLQRLAGALDEQGVTQSIADSIRQGDYNAAGDALSQLGDNNDQLSQDAKEALAESLDSAADDSSDTPDLRDAERKAADALRNGTYGEIKKAMDDLGQAVKDTGDQVVPQQDLAKNFPTQPSASTTPAAGQNGQSNQQDSSDDGQQSQDQSSQPGDSSQQGQGGITQPDAADNGQQPQPGTGDDGSGSPSQGAPGGPQSDQGQGSGAGDPGLPGEGSRVDGPKGQGLDVDGDPFALQGDEADPNNLRPGNGQEPPAMTLEGDASNSGGATSPSQGGPVDATGETTAPPMERWGIVQKYFSPESR